MQRRYPIDLSGNMAVCDANYIRLLKLLPDFALHTTREISLAAPGPDTIDSGHLVVMHVEECQRYTSSVSIQLHLQGVSTLFYRPPVIRVRLYHDANTAEVVSYQEQGSFHLRSHPGNGPEFTPDEKQQVNIFLAEWLTLCMQHGLGRRRLSEQDPDAEQLISSV
jgi:uncharacterized protein YqiB (DUF1249 family)